METYSSSQPPALGSQVFWSFLDPGNLNTKVTSGRGPEVLSPEDASTLLPSRLSLPAEELDTRERNFRGRGSDLINDSFPLTLSVFLTLCRLS